MAAQCRERERERERGAVAVTAMLQCTRQRRCESSGGLLASQPVGTAQIALYAAVVVVVVVVGSVINDATAASNEDEFERDIMTSRLRRLQQVACLPACTLGASAVRPCVIRPIPSETGFEERLRRDPVRVADCDIGSISTSGTKPVVYPC